MSHAMNFKAKLRLELYEKSIKPKRTASAPDLTSMNHRKKMPYSPLTKRHLSLMCLEHYAVDDTAAGKDYSKQTHNSDPKSPHAIKKNSIIKELTSLHCTSSNSTTLNTFCLNRNRNPAVNRQVTF